MRPVFGELGEVRKVCVIKNLQRLILKHTFVVFLVNSDYSKFCMQNEYKYVIYNNKYIMLQIFIYLNNNILK